MRTPCRHPRLASAACWVYSLTIRLYPREVQACLRSRTRPHLPESRRRTSWKPAVSREGLAFAAHIALDTLNTWATLATSSQSQDAVSLLGLTEGEIAQGGLDSATVDIHMMFVTAGMALTFAGWFAFFVILPKYVR